MKQSQAILKILGSATSKIVSISGIQKELQCSRQEAIQLFKTLQQEGNYTLRSYYGEYGEEKTTVEEWRPATDHQEPSFKIEGILSKKQQDILQLHTIANNTIEYIKKVWTRNRIIWYGIIDISRSEQLQQESETDYNNILSSLERNIKDADNKSGYEYKYFLGEIGDAFKLVITKKDKIPLFLDHLAKNLDTTIKLKCIFYSLPLRDHNRVNNYFRKTISGTYDINSENITKAFRLDSNKPSMEENSSYKIAALLDMDSIDKKNIEEEDILSISQEKGNKEDENSKKMYPIVYSNDNKKVEGKDAKKYFKN